MILISLFSPLIVVFAIFISPVVGFILGNYLSKIPALQNPENLKWLLILGLILTVFFLIGILVWAIYRDVWEGLISMAYIGSIGILLLISILFVISFFGQSRLLEQGERIITKVDNIVTYFEYDSETQITSRVYEVTYTIPLEEGKQKKIKKRIGAKLGQKLQKEDDLPVIYLPQNPSFSLPVEEINPLNRGKLALSGLLTIYLSFIEVWLIEFFWDKGLEDLMNKIDR
jgi:hypothetical protein